MRISDWSSDVCSSDLWWQYRDRPEPAPPIVSDRQRLVSAAITALRADPNVADIVYSPAGDQWDATPIAGTDDATAFARYVCFVLDAQHVTRPATSVRVIDNDRLEASGFDYNRRSEEHTSELQSLMRISYAVFCLKKKKKD